MLALTLCQHPTTVVTPPLRGRGNTRFKTDSISVMNAAVDSELFPRVSWTVSFEIFD